jgi:hypothetical protein
LEAATKLPRVRRLAADLLSRRGAHGCEFFACPRRRTTRADPKCKIGSACLAMRAIGLDGNGGPLRRRERPKCGARNRQGEPCAVRVEPGKARCRFHGGLSTGPRTLKVERELLRLSGDDGRDTAPPRRRRGSPSLLAPSALIREQPYDGALSTK